MSRVLKNLSCQNILEVICVVVQESGKQLTECQVIVGSERFELFIREGLQPTDVTFGPEPIRSHLLQTGQDWQMNSRLEVVNHHQS